MIQRLVQLQSHVHQGPTRVLQILKDAAFVQVGNFRLCGQWQTTLASIAPLALTERKRGSVNAFIVLRANFNETMEWLLKQVV